MQQASAGNDKPALDRATDASPTDRLLEQIDLPTSSSSVLLPSGRRVEIAAGDEGDRVLMRAADGRIVLHVELTDAGARLSFESAELELSATRRICLAASEVAIDAQCALTLSSGGDMSTRVSGNHHSRIAGEQRLEAAGHEIQANRGGVAVRAMAGIRLDGEHIGLNDDPCPRPFGWSEIADEEGQT